MGNVTLGRYSLTDRDHRGADRSDVCDDKGGEGAGRDAVESFTRSLDLV